MPFFRKLIFSVFFFSLFALRIFSFSKEDIISPCEGTWANLQALVMNLSDGSDVYYSLSDSDPYEQGFFYDGPVLIDATGPVTVRITTVSTDGVRSDYSVSYSVIPLSYQGNQQDMAVFLQNVSQSPILNLFSGENLEIPESLLYSMENDVDPYLPGRSLSVTSENCLDRYLPCSVSDGRAKYHFVIHTIPLDAETLPDRDVPFKITNWENFLFTGEMLIYQIDDSYWSADKNPVKLDRTIPHTIRWQSMAYEKGNPVYTYELPARTQLLSSKNQDGSASFWFDSLTGYKIGPVRESVSPVYASGTMSKKVSSKVTMDTVYGDDVGGSIILGVYYDNVYQGYEKVNYSVDRKPPVPPKFSSSAAGKEKKRGSYERTEVKVQIQAEADAAVYYAVSTPLTSEKGFEESAKLSFDSVVNAPSSFKRYKGEEIKLSSLSELASFYKLNAFAIDPSGNRSAVSEYTVIVDEYNYYLSTTGKTTSKTTPDGSYSNPFTNFDDAVKAINARSNTRLHIFGTVNLSGGETSIRQNCIIIANGNRLILPPGGTLKIEDAKVSITDCILEKRAIGVKTTMNTTDAEKLRLSRCLLLQNASFSLNGSEVVGVFASDGILLDSKNSTLSIENSGLTIQSDSYACAVNTMDSKVSCISSRVTSVSNSSVNFSITGGSCVLRKNTTGIIGRIGRALELSSVKAILTENLFNASLEGYSKGSTAVWKDADTVIEENLENDENGF